MTIQLVNWSVCVGVLETTGHAEFFHELSDECVADMSQVTKKVANAVIGATGEAQYNILQVFIDRVISRILRNVYFSFDLILFDTCLE